MSIHRENGSSDIWGEGAREGIKGWEKDRGIALEDNLFLLIATLILALKT
ncbi:hypothetical protein OLK001_02890 [Synechocystis sp. LKSZ1]